MPKSDLPFGSEFSPSQINLKRVLELLKEHEGDEKAFEKAIQTSYFDKNNPNASIRNRKKLANNTKLGVRAYGLINDEGNFTTVGSELYELRGKETELYKRLARHILLNLNGTSLVQCIQDMQAGGEQVSLVSLRERLEERGIHFPRGGKHPSIMRLWLEKAGVFNKNSWRVNEANLQEIRGIGTEELEALAMLTPGQRFFLRALLNLGGKGPYPASDVEKLATATYGFKYNEKGLAKDVLYPLVKAGYITIEKTTRAKSPNVSVTDKLLKDVFEPLLRQLEKLTADDLRPLLRRPLAEVVDELKSNDKHVKGLALEALAFKLMQLIDLNYLSTRLRGTATGGAEVDVIFESTRLVFSRWQVQCKNTATVSLDDVAKEVGLTHFLKSNVIVIVSTGEIGPEASAYAELIRGKLPINICCLNGDDLRNISASPAKVVDLFSLQAPLALCRKEPFSYLMVKSEYGRSAAVSVGT
jgi:hypothetical protein